MFAERLAGHSAARITRALNDAGVPCPSAADPARNPHRTGAEVDATHRRRHLGEPAVYGPAGVEPAAHRFRPGRPRQHRARAQAGAAVEPARRLGHLQASGACGAGQRGRFDCRPGNGRAARPGRSRCPPVPAGRAAGVRARKPDLLVFQRPQSGNSTDVVVAGLSPRVRRPKYQTPSLWREFEKVFEEGLEPSIGGFFPRVVKSSAACSSAAKTGEISSASVPERGPDPVFR